MAKSIEIIIRELVEKTKEANKRPSEIVLTEEHYTELREKVFKDTGEKIDQEWYESIPNGIVYHESRKIPHVDTYMGIPIRIGSETRIIFY